MSEHEWKAGAVGNGTEGERTVLSQKRIISLLLFIYGNSPGEKKKKMRGGSDLTTLFLHCFSNLDSGLKTIPTYKKPTAIKVKIKLIASRSIQEYELFVTCRLTKNKYNCIHKTLKYFCMLYHAAIGSIRESKLQPLAWKMPGHCIKWCIISIIPYCWDTA